MTEEEIALNLTIVCYENKADEQRVLNTYRYFLNEISESEETIEDWREI